MSHGLDAAWDNSEAGEGGLSNKETPDGDRIFYENCCCRIAKLDFTIIGEYSTAHENCFVFSFKRECEPLPQTWVTKKGQRCRPHSRVFFGFIDLIKKSGGTILSDPPAEVDCTFYPCCPSYSSGAEDSDPRPDEVDLENCCNPYVMTVCYARDGGIGSRPRYPWATTRGVTGGGGP